MNLYGPVPCTAFLCYRAALKNSCASRRVAPTCSSFYLLLLLRTPNLQYALRLSLPFTFHLSIYTKCKTNLFLAHWWRLPVQRQLGRTLVARCQYNFNSGILASGKTRMAPKQNHQSLCHSPLEHDYHLQTAGFFLVPRISCAIIVSLGLKMH